MPSLLLSQAHSRARSETEHLGLELVLLWEASVTGRGLTHCTTTLLPVCHSGLCTWHNTKPWAGRTRPVLDGSGLEWTRCMASGVGFDRGQLRAPGMASVWPTVRFPNREFHAPKSGWLLGEGAEEGSCLRRGPQQQTLRRKPGSLPGAAVRTGGRGDLNFRHREAPDPCRESSGSWNPRQAGAVQGHQCGCPRPHSRPQQGD